MHRLFIVLLLFSTFGLPAQKPVVNPRYVNAFWLVNLSYKAAFPVGDLALRYGFFNGAGLDVNYKSKKNFMFGVSGNLFFGSRVKDINYVNFLKDNNDYIFNDDGTPIFVSASMRGGQIQGTFGKLFPVFKKQPELSMLVQFGAGFLQHKYLFSAPGSLQFSKDFAKGYDRLSNGFALSQQVGICYLSLRRLINFKLGVELTEAFVKNRRYYDYATGNIDTKTYLDMILALKFSWVLPIKGQNANEPVYFK